MAFVGSVSFAVSKTKSAATCSVRKASAPASSRVIMMSDLQSRISEATKQAQDAAAKFGKTSKEAAVAWDQVEELEAEASHQKQKNIKKDPLEQYCEGNEDADECRTYEN
eukprot:CAMPEP_0184693142 /NCGR_PEP_ID=MMETSP0313-20130426/1419_1 /TAXON_ID=2792 /ORGANISM="Porphyridium aerugineum, Strain SAG 1380-2" /LENGTH=109 /DNA_ID=CAMNT_0027151121 /DNA_START=95 /DNA_END=424 /DNA_ORIENTATION=+